MCAFFGRGVCSGRRFTPHHKGMNCFLFFVFDEKMDCFIFRLLFQSFFFVFFIIIIIIIVHGPDGHVVLCLRVCCHVEVVLLLVVLVMMCAVEWSWGGASSLR